MIFLSICVLHEASVWLVSPSPSSLGAIGFLIPCRISSPPILPCHRDALDRSFHRCGCPAPVFSWAVWTYHLLVQEHVMFSTICASPQLIGETLL